MNPIDAKKLVALKRAAFDAVFETASFGMTIVDTQGAGRLIDANPALARMLGYDQDCLRNLSFPDFTHPDDKNTNLDLYRAVLEGRRDSYAMDKRYIRSDGQTLWVQLTGTAVRNPAGETEFVVGIQEDITTRVDALHKRQAAEFQGLLPICSYCKRIRDEEGQWTAIEEYLSARTPARYSHGICPHCVPDARRRR